MVIEEAWLAGLLSLPSGAPDFYDAPQAYTQAIWIGPSRGYVDPVKEIAATVTALENRLMTYSEALAERGRDFDEVMDEREEEEARLARFTPQPTKASTYKDDGKEERNASV
jgi:capsid protein